ncbi:MAG: hypothetical protein AVDCRST_MAG67-2017 [uncultured Solirubrobacteraceae bacterium]|uniref:Uncharacterized protein n=1 Tax=uncultured Solirubrobacteraceae bacterium TaxID=1162706 RepID=A0A6J4SL78_9ACTN|nr:MAG: hypothetical protein AVDCRST_MAG67-2017 [uncultured Solirubrobacteraceae bacterium]
MAAHADSDADGKRARLDQHGGQATVIDGEIGQRALTEILRAAEKAAAVI